MKLNKFFKNNYYLILLILITLMLIFFFKKNIFYKIEGLRSRGKKNIKKKRVIKKKGNKKNYSIGPYGRNKRCGFFTNILDLIFLIFYLVGLPGYKPNYKDPSEWMRVTRRFKQSKRFCKWEKKEAELQYLDCVKKKKGCPPIYRTHL